MFRANSKTMIRNVLMSVVLMLACLGAFGQTIDRNKLEQIKKQSRVNLHVQKNVEGKILKLLYDPGVEYLDGFVLQTNEGKVFKVEVYHFYGTTIYPYLKVGENVTATLRGDADLMNGMLYKSNYDRETERQLKVKYRGTALLKSIKSSHGSIDLPSFDKMKLMEVPRFSSIVTDAQVVEYKKGKKNSITLILDNGDTINTFESDEAKSHYLDGKVSYVRPNYRWPGAYHKTQHTYYMVLTNAPLIPTAKELKIPEVGIRSSFIDKKVNLRYVSQSKTGRGLTIVSDFVDTSGETIRLNFDSNDEALFNEFLEESGGEGIDIYYRRRSGPFYNYLFAVEKNGKKVLLNTPDATKPSTSEEKMRLRPKLSTKREFQTTKGQLLKYLTTYKGLYAGFLLLDESKDTLTFRIWDTHGQDMLNNFKPGDMLEVRFENLAAGNIMMDFFNTPRPDIETFDKRSMNMEGFHALYSWFTSLTDDPNDPDQKNGFKINSFVAEVKSDKASLEMDRSFGSLEMVYNPAELHMDVKVIGVDKKKGDTRFYMENGDTLYMNVAGGRKKGDRLTYTITHPIVLKGQVYEDPDYKNEVKEVVWANKRKVRNLEPVYDDWLRIMGYEADIDGKKALLRVATDAADEVNTFLQNNKEEDITLICNDFSLSRKTDDYYFFRAFVNEKGDIAMDNMVREPQFYETDTTFSAKVKEIVKHIDIYTYRNSTIVLENGFVFSVNNRTFGSIEAHALVGSEVTVTGKPFIPRNGEVLREENFRLIKPSILKAGNVEFNLGAR